MSLINFIEKIQNKPRHIRVQILWWSVLFTMFFVVSGWVISLKHSLSLAGEKDQARQAEESPQAPSLIESFKASIGSFFQKNQEEILDAPEGAVESPENKVQIQKDSADSANNQDKSRPAVLPLSQ